MPFATIPDISKVLAERTLPTITLWNRFEGRPRREDFSRALKAEVRDALWMLSKQWQLGEFEGDDAGSPISTKLRLTTTVLKKYRAAGHDVEPFEDNVPLEAKVERRPIPAFIGGAEVSLDLRLLMGRHWLKLMKSIPGDFAADFATKYPIHSPDPTQVLDAPYCAHPEIWSAFAAAAGRMDGAKLYEYLADDSHHASDGIAGLAGHESDVDLLAQKFVAFFERLFYQPPPNGDDAWTPDRLEYQFACSAPEAAGEKVLTADEYYQGHLDWYNLDIDASATTLGEPAPPDPDLSRIRRADVDSDVADFSRHAEYALVGLRGRPHEFWRREARYDRSREIAADRIRSRLRKRLVHHSVSTSGGYDRTRGWNGGDERLRRAHVD